MIRRTGLFEAALVCCLAAGSALPALAYTPESPEVKAMVGRGVAYIEGNFGRGQMDDELGGVCICALACYSQTGDADHPVVQKAIARIKQDARRGFKQGAHENYGLGIALILLGTIEREHRAEMLAVVQEVQRRQQASGAWTYPGDPLGDTSQTQFACLGMWMASHRGVEVDQQAVERVCNWLLRIQEPSGVFPYKGEDPGTYTRIEQRTQTSASMCAAGTGSLYVCGELLGFVEPDQMRTRMELPPAFRPSRVEVDDAITKFVNQGIWQVGVNDGNRWMSRNARVENFDEYHKAGYQQYYYLYALERYFAFQELALDRRQDEPVWYNAGVDYCKKRQAANGSWKSNSGQGASIDTAFAVLFLLRSSTRIVVELSPKVGVVKGEEPGTLGEYNGSTTDRPLSDLLDQLEKAPRSEYLSNLLEKLVLPDDPTERNALQTRLRRLAINGGFHARLVAARTLGTTRDLDNAPALIFALSDPDYRVIRAARDSLRFISRKPTGFDLDINGTERPTEAAWTRAQADWKDWLLSVKPDAELIE